jgi:hypothetical protein
MAVFQERRGPRSESKREALTLQLRACARRAGVEALVLADHRGKVLARSDHAQDVDEIASFSPFLAKPKTWFGAVRLDTGERKVAISSFRLGKKTAYLCAVGVQHKNVGGAFLQATAGVRRILGFG